MPKPTSKNNERISSVLLLLTGVIVSLMILFQEEIFQMIKTVLGD